MICAYSLQDLLVYLFVVLEKKIRYQQYIGKVKQAVFHTQKAGRKRVVVSTEENVVASLDLRHGEICKFDFRDFLLAWEHDVLPLLLSNSSNNQELFYLYPAVLNSCFRCSKILLLFLILTRYC